MNLYDEYKPLVKDVCGSKKYYIVLNENQIEVDIDIFIQFFGVHKLYVSMVLVLIISLLKIFVI